MPKTKIISELASSDFRLLLGLTTIAVIEAITYAWIEELLYSSDSGNPQLVDTWVFGHYTTYHVVLSILVLAMIFGVGFVAWLTYSSKGFWKFLFLALGNFLLWLFLEDEFFFIFSHSPHTATDWTNWPLGAVNLSGHYIPIWYIGATISIFVLWFLGLSMKENENTKGKIELLRG